MVLPLAGPEALSPFLSLFCLLICKMGVKPPSPSEQG